MPHATNFDTMEVLYLKRDEFIDYRNIQDEQLNVEFRMIRNDLSSFREETKQEFKAVRKEIDDLQNDLSSFREETKQEFKAVRKEIDGLRQEVSEVKFDQKRLSAWMRNAFKKNPIMRIEPVPILHPVDGIVEPDPRMFPRNAREFYALRRPTTKRQENMLSYLYQFYDIQSLTRDRSSDGEDAEEEGYMAEKQDLNEMIVEHLEGILGLQEDNFLAFAERAAQRAQEAELAALTVSRKRQQAVAPVGQPAARQQRLSPTLSLPPEMQPLTEEERCRIRGPLPADPAFFLHSQKQSSEASFRAPSTHMGWKSHSTPEKKMGMLAETAGPISNHGDGEGSEAPTNKVTTPDSARIRGE